MEEKAGKKCVHCGGELPEGTHFCLACGTSQQVRPGAATGNVRFGLRWIISAALVVAVALLLGLSLFIRSTAPNPVQATGTPVITSMETSEPDELGSTDTIAEGAATSSEEKAGESNAPAEKPGESNAPAEKPAHISSSAGGSTAVNTAPVSSAPSATVPATTTAPVTTAPVSSTPSATVPATTTAPVTTAHVHSYHRVVTRESTCAEEGVATLVCDGCGDSFTEPIPCHSTVDGKCAVCGLYCYQGKSAHLVNDFASSTANLFLSSDGGVFQDFRIVSCRFYTKNGVLRASGRASVEGSAACECSCQIWTFFTGQNQFTTPLTSRTVTVISKGKTGTVDFDVPLADWSTLAATGYTAFEIYFADNV